MPSVYDPIYAGAVKVIELMGDALIVVTYVDVAALNPMDPPTRTKVEWGGKGVFAKYKVEEIDGSLILRGDQYVLVDGRAKSLPVSNNGTLVRGSENWKIMRIEEIKPGPLTILYKIQVRQ